MRRFLVAFLLLNVATIYLVTAKTVVLTDHENSNIVEYQQAAAAGIGSSEDNDVINFCRMCKSYVTLFQQADDTVEIRMPLEDLCDDVEENDQNLCLESIDNLHRLSSFDDLSTVDNLEVCQLVSLCEEMSSSEEDESANGSDSVEKTGSEQVMESNDDFVDFLGTNSLNGSNGLNGPHGVHGANGVNGAHGTNGANGAHGTPGFLHPPQNNGHQPGLKPVHHHNGHHNGHQNGQHTHHGKHHNGASSNAVLSSTLLLLISILISKKFRSA